jgi:hypothetical protein
VQNIFWLVKNETAQILIGQGEKISQPRSKKMRTAGLLENVIGIKTIIGRVFKKFKSPKSHVPTEAFFNLPNSQQIGSR